MTNINFENKRILDVVNENDEISGSASRIDVHHLGLIHREIHVWMFDENKNIFFQRNGLHKKSAGLLDATVGGHLDKGEEYINAAIRETEEETSIKIASSDLVLIKKIRIMDDAKDNLGSTINNCIRSVYVYKNPIDEKKLKKESGIAGGGFQKLSYNFLRNLPEEHKRIIKDDARDKELQLILKYLSVWKN